MNQCREVVRSIIYVALLVFSLIEPAFGQFAGTVPIFSVTQVPNPTIEGAISIGPLVASAINNKGEVLGSISWNEPGEGFENPFIYSAGVSTLFGIFGGHQAQAADINDSGQFVGGAQTHPPVFGLSNYMQAFLYSNGTATDLDGRPGGQSFAYGINNAGQITGQISTTTCSGTPFSMCPFSLPPGHAFLYANGVLKDLGTLGGDISSGKDINNLGQIVGTSNVTAGGPQHAILYEFGTFHDLGTQFTPVKINDFGEILGSNGHAYLYVAGTLHDLGTLGGTGSSPTGINDLGVIVGSSIIASGAAHAFIYVLGHMFDLNDLVESPPTVFTGAVDINNSLQIVATGADGHFYVLTPKL